MSAPTGSGSAPASASASAPASAPASVPGTSESDRRRSLGKYVKRMSSVFKRDKPGKTTTTTAAGTSSTPLAPSTPAPKAEEKEAAPAAAPAAIATTQTPTPATTTATATATAPTAAPKTLPAPVTQQLNRSALQQERAIALFAKYGLTLEAHEWITTPAQPISVQRIERPIRMRIHRICHHCGTTYGADKVCAKCEHRRCKKCPRYPKKKTPADKGKDTVTEPAERPKKKKVLTVTNKAGQERVYQPVKQRVRRTCHKCEALFLPPTATVCEQCRHVRCTKCPREPAKVAKWPHGYPGDAPAESDTEVERELEREPIDVRRVWKKPKTRVRWECEECQTLFMEGNRQCPGCGHERCDTCTRKPIKKTKGERAFDPEVIRAVEAKLRALSVDHPPPFRPEAV